MRLFNPIKSKVRSSTHIKNARRMKFFSHLTAIIQLMLYNLFYIQPSTNFNLMLLSHDLGLGEIFQQHCALSHWPCSLLCSSNRMGPSQLGPSKLLEAHLIVSSFRCHQSWASRNLRTSTTWALANQTNQAA